MADYTVIADTALDPDAPLTSELAYAWRDNLIAVTEGAPGAPRITFPAMAASFSTAGGIGSYAFASSSTTAANFGDVRAGSAIVPTAASRGDTAANVNAGAAAIQSGTWRCMGQYSGGAGTLQNYATLWVRIT